MTEVDLQNSGMSNHVERKGANTTTASNDQSSIANEGGKMPSMNGEKKEKKRAPLGIFRAALFMMRRPAAANEQKKKSSTKSSSDKAAEEDGKWKKLVGSMRPLHLQDNQSPPPSLKGLSPSPTAENLEDLARRPSSASSASSPYSVSGGMSQYASACNLQELDCSDDEEDDDPDEVFDAIRGDEMIDAKAAEFIAQFYHQMKLQHAGGPGPAQ